MRKPCRHLAEIALLTVAAVTADCSCGPADRAEISSGETVVVVSAVDHDVTIRRGGRLIMDMDAAGIGTKRGVASYEMQFGMFNIVEDSRPFRPGTTLRLLTADADSVGFEVMNGGDAIATGHVSFDQGGAVVEFKATNGDRVVASTPCAPDHHFLGLGAQSADVDHRGQVVPLWVSEQGVGKTDDDVLPGVWQLLGRRHTTHVPMPALLRSDGVGVMLDVDAFSRVDLCATNVDITSFEVWQDTLRMVVLPADTVLGAQQLLSEALGRPRLLPPFVFAPWNDAIFSEQEVRDFAAFLRENEIPTSVIWSEDWRGGEDAGNLYRLDEDWRLDRDVYPTYEAMATDLRAEGIAHQVYFNTFVTEGGDVFDEVTAAGHGLHHASTGDTLLFTGADREFSPTALMDLTNPEAIAAMKAHLHEALRLGARGWMADYAEWMPVDDVALASGEDPALVHNEYAVAWARLNREVIEEAGLLDEVILYSRSGFLGSPAVVDVLWAGDQRTSFQADDGLPTIIPIGIGAAVTGFTYFAHDIAGYQSSTNVTVSPELFFRWTTLGAFTPVMRTHHGTHARANHMLQTDPDSTAHWKRYAEIHIRLYPYLRALAVADANADTAVATGLGRLPLWVPMPVLFPDDAALWSIKDQVLLGPNLLVAPVVTEGALARTVVLPGGRFVAFPMPGAPPGSLGASRTDYVGTVSVDAAVAEIPVFMPAGAIVPMTALPAQTLLEVDGDAIADLSSTQGDREVAVALGKSGRFVEEDGASYVLDGTGTALPTEADAVGAVEVVGDGVVNGDGFTLTLAGHPSGRRTRVVFR